MQFPQRFITRNNLLCLDPNLISPFFVHPIQTRGSIVVRCQGAKPAMSTVIEGITRMA